MILLCINRPIIHPQLLSCIYKHAVTKNLVNFISSQRFDFVTDTSCIHEDCRRLTELLMRSIEHSTVSNVYCQNSRCSWITAAIINSIKHKHMLYKKSLKGKIIFEEFRAYWNKLTSIIRQSKKQYFVIFAIGISLMLRKYRNKLIP